MANALLPEKYLYRDKLQTNSTAQTQKALRNGKSLKNNITTKKAVAKVTAFFVVRYDQSVKSSKSIVSLLGKLLIVSTVKYHPSYVLISTDHIKKK